MMNHYLTLNKRNRYLFTTLLMLAFIGISPLKAQQSTSVLFLGNSYTGVNNLPKIVSDIALSVGDTLIYDSNTPGGYTLLDHTTNATSQNKIAAGGWDYMVIQGQSRESILGYTGFKQGVNLLYNQFKQSNSCSVVMPYMTWGRENGDATFCSSFPVMCTYEGMDTTIRDRYLTVTEDINGEVSPVSVVWRYLRQNHPSIDLYQTDGSHPSAAGSYAAACCFYAAIFKKDPTLITYNFGLNAADAAAIKNAAKLIVYDSLSLWDYKKPALADIRYTIGSGVNEILVNSFNIHGVKQDYLWDFGDGTTSTLSSTSHSYSADGTYTVTLTTTNCDLQGTYTSVKDTVVSFCSHTPTITTTNTWLCNEDTLWTQAADSYQWLSNGVEIPETNQYLADYQRYNISGFTVISTVNGCSELSVPFSGSPEWSGYFFDVLGDPCNGDTVAFAVLHFNGSLTGAETILWYKNNVLLPSMTNEDTLLITSGGIYESKVINPNSNCPLDTTAYSIEYNCNQVGIDDVSDANQDLFWNVFPNPASESITIDFKRFARGSVIQVYNSYGSIVREIKATQTTTINITDLESGMYFIRLKDSKQAPAKFMKL